MTSNDIMTALRRQGKADAMDLAKRAASMSETELVAEEQKIPLFVWGRDYSQCPAGAPIAEMIDGELQIFTMLIPVNTGHYPGIRPNTERNLYSICHTKDPAVAKPWIAPQGISGLYQKEECCTYPHPEGNVHVFRNRTENNPYPPMSLNREQDWEDLGPATPRKSVL